MACNTKEGKKLSEMKIQQYSLHNVIMALSEGYNTTLTPANSSKACFATPFFMLCALTPWSLTMPIYAPCFHGAYSEHAYTQYSTHSFEQQEEQMCQVQLLLTVKWTHWNTIMNNG